MKSKLNLKATIGKSNVKIASNLISTAVSKVMKRK